MIGTWKGRKMTPTLLHTFNKTNRVNDEYAVLMQWGGGCLAFVANASHLFIMWWLVQPITYMIDSNRRLFEPFATNTAVLRSSIIIKRIRYQCSA